MTKRSGEVDLGAHFALSPREFPPCQDARLLQSARSSPWAAPNSIPVSERRPDALSVTKPPLLANVSIRSLLPEQMWAPEINTRSAPERAQAWVLWEDGIEELAQAQRSSGPNGPCGSGSQPHAASIRAGSA